MKFQFYRFLQHGEKALFLFGRSGFNALGGIMAAQAAEVMRFSTFDAHDANAGVAHHLFAVGAAKSGGGFRNDAGRGGKAVLQNHRGRRGGFAALSNCGMAMTTSVDSTSSSTSPNRSCWPGNEPGFRDRFTVDEGAVGGIAIAHVNAVIGQREFTQCNEETVVWGRCNSAVGCHDRRG